jgi:hypothetical protein
MRYLLDFMTRPAFKFIMMALLAAIVLVYVVHALHKALPAADNAGKPAAKSSETLPGVYEYGGAGKIVQKAKDEAAKAQQQLDDSLKEAQKALDPPPSQ